MIASNGDEIYKDALSDLEQAVKLDPSNEFIKNEYRDALAKMKKKVEEEEKAKPQAATNAAATTSINAKATKNQIVQLQNSQAQQQPLSAFTTLPYQDENKLMEEIPEISSLNE